MFFSGVDEGGERNSNILIFKNQAHKDVDFEIRNGQKIYLRG